MRARGQRRDHRRVGGAVAQCDGDVAQPLGVADAAQGAAGSAGQKGGFVPMEQFDQRCVVQSMAGQKIDFRRGARESIPGADQLAVVAAVDAVAYQWPERFGNGLAQFDGEV